MINKRRLSLTNKRAVNGLLFISPLIIGFILLFAVPLINSFITSVSRVELTNSSYKNVFVGFINYKNILFEHPTFIRSFVTTFTKMLKEVPLVLVFSFFISTLLNQKFKGRLFARALFFLPVIISSGIVMRIENIQYVQNYVFHQGSVEGTALSNMLGGIKLAEYITALGVAPELIGYITNELSKIYDIINASGVQILIFISALQTIPDSLYEASSIEGATAWENFWKITFPMLSPYILVCTIYTIIDSFLRVDSEYYNVTRLIEETVNVKFDYGIASAMAWIYFVAVGLFLGIVSLVITKYVSYTE